GGNQVKLLSMTLKNFRQFYREQELMFASDSRNRNVTVIHGYNGAGKTALLNAFVWALYGELTPDLEAPERLQNEAAVAETPVGGELEVFVRLSFSIRDSRYIVQRRIVCVRESTSDTRPRAAELLLWKIVDGEMEAVGYNNDDRQRRVDQFLPKGLYPF